MKKATSSLTNTGYEDLYDHDHFAKDQMLAIAVGKTHPTGMDRKSGRNKGKPLVGKSTLNGLELTPPDASSNATIDGIFNCRVFEFLGHA